MPLRSRLFAGDPLLEACAVRDSAHLTPGTRGTHVGKVQYSLDVIDRLKIARQELIGQVYGPSTAQAVLSFKSRRSIINRAYQSTADNIVGRMTIAALDAEMLQKQNLNLARGECARAGGGGLIASRTAQGFASTVGGPPSKGPPQLSKKLRVVFGITKETSGPFDLGAQIQAANKALGVYGMSLDVQFGTSTPDSLPTAQSYVIEDDIIEIRKASETVRPGLPNVLRVVVCKMGTTNFGETHRGKVVDALPVKPFVFLNVNMRDVSDATLLHEMIHASHSQIQKHDGTPPSSVFFKNGSTDVGSVRRTDLPEAHARELANAYFT
jgi:peptidoglycan hydrolase-like protein with peptidoglycan-binding domain